MPASYSWSTSSRRARRKVLQQLAEEVRAEYMEGKEAAAGGTRWVAEEATAAAADTQTEAVLVPKELQTEPNVRHLQCHKLECGNCSRKAEVICRL